VAADLALDRAPSVDYIDITIGCRFVDPIGGIELDLPPRADRRATRDTRHFAQCGVELVNPWNA
jgi:hypothetical protein